MSNLESLSRRLLDAKAYEALAKQKRIELEEQIAKLVPFDPNERKQKTEKLSNGGKVVVKRDWNYRADMEKLLGLRLRRPPLKQVFDKTIYEWHKKHQPEVFVQYAQHVTVTPAKVSVTVELPDE